MNDRAAGLPKKSAKLDHSYNITISVFPYVSVTTENLSTFILSLLPFFLIILRYIKKGKSQTSLL